MAPKPQRGEQPPLPPLSYYMERAMLNNAGKGKPSAKASAGKGAKGALLSTSASISGSRTSSPHDDQAAPICYSFVDIICGPSFYIDQLGDNAGPFEFDFIGLAS